jgi:hypothetical protein
MSLSVPLGGQISPASHPGRRVSPRDVQDPRSTEEYEITRFPVTGMGFHCGDGVFTSHVRVPAVKI